MSKSKRRENMKKTSRRERGLAKQYREVFPPSYLPPDYVDPEHGSPPVQYVISQNFTTYGAGEVPIPAPLGLRRA
jgi:hypothetical protein